MAAPTTTINTDAGRERALALVLENLQTPGEMAQTLATEFGASIRTAKRWIRHARTEGLRRQADIDVGDPDGSRWVCLARYDSRARRLRALADARYAGDKDDQPVGLRFERTAIDYEKMIASALHFSLIPPDRELDQPEQQDLIVRALERALSHFPRDKVARLRNACDARLQGGLDESDPQAEAEWQREKAEIDEVI